MNLRAVMNITLLVVLCGVSSRLIVGEFVQKEIVEVKQNYIDPLRDITYTAIDRKENLIAFGLSPTNANLAIKKLERYREKYKTSILKKINSTSEAESVVEAFCGQQGLVTSARFWLK